MTAVPAEPSIAPATLRDVLGRFATGVTAVTGIAGGAPAGLAVNSFTSVSLTPPMVLFCVAHTSTTWPRIRDAGVVCVNILGKRQHDAARRLAASDEDKFATLAWTASPSGLPVLDGAVAWLECAIVRQHRAGDHDIIVAGIRRLQALADGPLVFYRGGYGRFVPAE